MHQHAFSHLKMAFKSTEIEFSSDYMTCIKKTGSKNTYNVFALAHSDVSNFDLLNEQAFKKDAFKGIIKAHHIKYVRQEPHQIFRY